MRCQIVKISEKLTPMKNLATRRCGEFWPPSVADTEHLLGIEDKNKLKSIDTKIASKHSQLIDFQKTTTAKNESQLQKLAVHVGGNVYQTEGDPVPRGVPTFAGISLPIPEDQSGRVQLARWLVHPENPLTARVLVNRIWHWHFDKGISRTPDDFGLQGSKPTHPELLDWLASELMENNWSIKHIQRLILKSNTYRASSEITSKNQLLDPNGALFSRFPKRRLEVEAIYDSMLTAIGKVPRQISGADLDTSKSKDRALYILTSSRSPHGFRS